MSHIPSFRSKLACLSQFIDDTSCSEIAINRPGEVWTAHQGSRYMVQHEVPELNSRLLNSLAALTADFTAQKIDSTRPLLSATIPIDLSDGLADNERGGYRIQIVQSPAVEQGAFGMCIRKPTLLDLDLADYREQGAFDHVNKTLDEDKISNDHLDFLFKEERWEDFLQTAVQAHKNIMISAGTFAGKTTLLNALLKHIPEYERIVTIEDSREVRPRQQNRLHLLYSRGDQGEAQVSVIDLLQVVLRLSPDRVIPGELRGAEAYAYLELLNSGHEGSISTIHADSPELMFDRLAQMVMRFGAPLGRSEIIDYARSLLHVVVQFKYASNGSRYITDIWYQGKRRAA
ncbi:P-type DNA transfer ATPase VirB11 [Chromobacterium vaccinii]|uniref:P-type DNA transfer ATPase VirB11 n=1 Tax=Chromobacterium vaccinii TaxID=1108595 RepID=UPI00345B18A0